MSQASIQNYFGELMTDFEGACYGQYFLEFADYYTRENADGSDFLEACLSVPAGTAGAVASEKTGPLHI